MRLANARIVSQLQARTRDAFYGDTAYFLLDVPTGAYDEYNNAVTELSEVPVSCSFTDKPSNELWREYADIGNVDAEIRLADIVPTKGRRVRLAGRFDGLTMADKDFEIIGIRDRDVFGYVCALKAVMI